MCEYVYFRYGNQVYKLNEKKSGEKFLGLMKEWLINPDSLNPDSFPDFFITTSSELSFLRQAIIRTIQTHSKLGKSNYQIKCDNDYEFTLYRKAENNREVDFSICRVLPYSHQIIVNWQKT